LESVNGVVKGHFLQNTLSLGPLIKKDPLQKLVNFQYNTGIIEVPVQVKTVVST